MVCFCILSFIFSQLVGVFVCLLRCLFVCWCVGVDSVGLVGLFVGVPVFVCCFCCLRNGCFIHLPCRPIESWSRDPMVK